MSRAHQLLAEYDYQEYVGAANKLQQYISGVGAYQVTRDELAAQFPDMDMDELENAIDILVSNAALYPETGSKTSYYINKSRASSALL